MHLRKQIRDAAASAVTGLAFTGVRVHRSRNLPLDPGTEFPCLCVYARQEGYDYESAAMASDNRPLVPRLLEVHVVGYALNLDGPELEDALDRMAEEVETALFTEFPFDGLALGMTLGQQTLDIDADGEKTLAAIDMVFNVMYRTAEGAPGTAL